MGEGSAVMNLDWPGSEEDERMSMPWDELDEDVFQTFTPGDEPWVLPSRLPGMPPGGVEPEKGDSCEALNMDPMPETDPQVVAAKWAGIYEEGKFPWCIAKGEAPPPKPTNGEPTFPKLPEKLPTTEGEIDKFCRGQEYVPEKEATKNMWIAGGVGAGVGVLVGGLIGALIAGK